MHISVLDLFSIGIGPASSHTVGPMRAACEFVEGLVDSEDYQSIARIKCDLYGSLAATGKGHGTGVAIIFGFMGEMPESIEVPTMDARMETLKESGKMTLPGGREIDFIEREDLDFLRLFFG